MQVYRLEPKSDTTRDQNWSTSRLKERCWVLPRSETDARLKLTLVTGIAVPLRPGKRFPTSPWIDRDLTACTLDDSSNHRVPAGVIVTESEKIAIQPPAKPN
jgi:hypothetical protein